MVALPADPLRRAPRAVGGAAPATAGARPEGIRQAAAVMGVTPGYLESLATFYDLFRTTPVGRHQVLVCHNISCWMRGADDLLAGLLRGRRRRCPRGRPRRRQLGGRGGLRTGFECLGACDIAPDGLDRRALLRAARAPATRRPRSSSFAPAPRCSRTRRSPTRPAAGGPEPGDRDPRGDEAALRPDALPEHRRARAGLDRHLPSPRRLHARWSAPSATWSPRSCSACSRSPGCAAAAGPASRWERRPRSCPAARWRSTCAATPTSPSRARSRTAS